jgi:hypothetical protein
MSATDPRDARDVAWLDAREAGGSALPPIDADRAAAYDQLQALIAALPDLTAPEGWQNDVMAALPSDGRADAVPSPADRRHSPANREAPGEPAPLPGAASGDAPAVPRRDLRSHRRRWNPAAAAVTAVAVAAAGLLLWSQRQPAPVRDALDSSVWIVSATGSRHGEATGEASIGDVLRADVAEVAGAELRIYRDDRELVLRCPGQAGCGRASGRTTAALHLTSPGAYRVVYFLPVPAQVGVSPGAPPAPSRPPTGTLEGDLAACGCASRTAAPIVAR